MSRETVVHWHRQDLRTSDHPALSSAAARDAAVVPVYVLDDEGDGRWALGGASRWWLHHSLQRLGSDIAKRGSPLVLRRGPVVETLVSVAREAKATTISFTRGYDPVACGIEKKLKSACDEAGIELKRYPGFALFEPETVRTKTGEPFRVFSPFWRACEQMEPPRLPLEAPVKFEAPSKPIRSDTLESWKLLPTKPDWAGGMRQTWTPGEAGAMARLAEFLDEAASTYANDRNRPDKPGTSRLSPHLHFGEISPRQVWHAGRIAAEMAPKKGKGVASFIREVGWREFSIHLLFHFPSIATEPFRPEFANFPWADDKKSAARNLAAWQKGMTGYPIVDAGMRELWQTGWMHNRVRMIVASLLCKHMLIHWHEGARWFWDTLVDADLANNQASWQWVAGSGADAAPYFRVFNPMLQGAKFDPEGHYVRRFVPELANLPDAHIHAPWEAPAAVLEAAGVELGKSYPSPIVGHAEGRARALAAYAAMRGEKTPVPADEGIDG